MRIGLMLGPERGRYRHKVAQLIADAEAAERDGFTSIWVPQIPGDFDAFTMITLLGRATQRIELGTAVLPIQTRHPIAMAQEFLSNQAVCEGRFTLGLGASHHWVIEGQLGLAVRAARPPGAQLPRSPERGPQGPGLGGRRERRVPRAQPDGRHGPWPESDRARRPRPGDAPRRRRARVGNDPVDGRRACHGGARRPAHHEGRRRGRGRLRGSSPGSPSRSAPRTRWTPRAAWANQALGHAEYSPNYQRLLEHGDATDVGDILAAGDESAVA